MNNPVSNQFSPVFAVAACLTTFIVSSGLLAVFAAQASAFA
ncbi:hypothetical protein [Parasphingopyxis algicola]|nr:hypothetical protein [Parasphingopyxis algicola]